MIDKLYPNLSGKYSSLPTKYESFNLKNKDYEQMHMHAGTSGYLGKLL